MNNHSVDGWFRHGIGVVPAAMVLCGIAAFEVPGAGQESQARGKKIDPGSRTVRLVSGDPASFDAVIAGGPAGTAILAITPVPAKAGSYPAGTTIVGNELRAEVGGFRAFFDVQVSSWDPNNDNVPQLKVYQVKVDASGFSDADAPGDQPDLWPSKVSCPGNDPTPCVAAFGESWAECRPDDTCAPWYIDLVGIGRPGLLVCALCG